MQLPLILDIVIGLFFIYLTLSLLASEIQEIVATLLQWRAEHLKKSIEILLAGGSQGVSGGASASHRQIQTDLANAQKLADRLYENPILNSLNQEARGFLAEWFRKLFRGLYRLFRVGGSVFGRRNSGPSYIPSAAFAEALLSTFKIPDLIRLLSVKRLEKFARSLHADIAKLLQPVASDPDVVRSLKKIKTQLDAIVADYREEKVSLTGSLRRISDLLDRYIAFLQSRNNYLEVQQMRVLKDDRFAGTEAEEALLAALTPSAGEILESLRSKKALYDEIQAALKELTDPKHSLRRGATDALGLLPDAVQETLISLAQRARLKATSARDEFAQFQTEIETWFARSQERASGVYRRNARGVAVLIGFAIAVAGNADTFYMAGNLATNSAVRNAVTQYSEQAVLQVQQDIDGGRDPGDALRERLNPALEELSLPIGWGKGHWQRQLGIAPAIAPEPAPASGTPASGTPDPETPASETPETPEVASAPTAPAAPEPFVSPTQRVLRWIWPRLRAILGWAITGIAISMGSAFWFDLLRKIVSARNTGNS